MPSTVIRWTHYDPETRRMLVVFQTGRRYTYENVPPEVHAGLRAASSRGSYFNQCIRDRYPYSRVEDVG